MKKPNALLIGGIVLMGLGIMVSFLADGMGEVKGTILATGGIVLFWLWVASR